MTKINFQPLGEQVLIKAPKVEDKTIAGIIKPESVLNAEKEKTSTGFLEVVGVGDKVTTLSIGDQVLINGGQHRAIELEGETYLVIYYGLIIGKKVNAE